MSDLDEPLPYDPASHYDRVTDAWALLLGEDLHYGVFHQGSETLAAATLNLTQLMIDAAELEPDVTLLDVGCGSGTQSCFLASRHKVKTTGITTSAVGVAAAKAKATRLKLAGRATFEIRDGMDNGFPDQSFDRVWALESSHLMKERDRLIAECARVLKPGGKLVLCDIVRKREMPFLEVRRLRVPLALLRDVFGDARMDPPESYDELAVANGLVVETNRDLTALTRTTFDRWHANATEHRDAVIELTSEEYWERFVESCDVLRGFWDDSTLGYFLFAAAKTG